MAIVHDFAKSDAKVTKEESIQNIAFVSTMPLNQCKK
jgi:hypothetical protein